MCGNKSDILHTSEPPLNTERCCTRAEGVPDGKTRYRGHVKRMARPREDRTDAECIRSRLELKETTPIFIIMGLNLARRSHAGDSRGSV